MRTLALILFIPIMAVMFARPSLAESLDGYLVVDNARGSYPLAYTTLEICPVAGGRCRRVTSGNDGRFYISGLSPGGYTVRVSRRNGEYRTRINVQHGGDTYVRIVVED